MRPFPRIFQKDGIHKLCGICLENPDAVSKRPKDKAFGVVLLKTNLPVAVVDVTAAVAVVAVAAVADAVGQRCDCSGDGAVIRVDCDLFLVLDLC